MKALFYPVIALTLLLTSCGKSKPFFVHGSGPTGNWLLVQKEQTFGPTTREIRPARDSSVLLTLNDDSTFVSKLDNKVISQGTYSITRDTSLTYLGTMELKSFKTTGIFSLFYLYEQGPNGQVYDGLGIKVSNDTMTLSSVITPGGWISYMFVKE